MLREEVDGAQAAWGSVCLEEPGREQQNQHYKSTAPNRETPPVTRWESGH